jgi:hypothetical protein
VLVVLSGDVGVVGVVVADVVDVELEAVESGFTTLNRDILLSQVAHGSGFGGSTSIRSMPVSQQSAAAWSQQKDVLVLVTLLQDIKSGPRFGAAFQACSAGISITHFIETVDECRKLEGTYINSSRGGNRATPRSDPYTTL